MSILHIFKSKSSKSKAKKPSVSAPAAVATTYEFGPAVIDDSVLTAPVQVVKGHQRFLGPVVNNNNTTANSHNTNVGNVNSNITGDSITIQEGINEIIHGPAKMLFTPEGATWPTRIRDSMTVTLNGGLVADIPLDLPSSGLGLEGNPGASDPDLPTKLEQFLRAQGLGELAIRHSVDGLKVALQMQGYVPPTA